MTTGRSRKLITGGAAVVGGVMLLSSGAYACTVFKGQMTVKDATHSSFATGNNTSMAWCTGGKPDDDTTVAAGGGAHGADGSAITVTIQPGTVCGAVSPRTRTSDGLAVHSYDINFYNGNAFSYTISGATGRRVYTGVNSGGWNQDCMTPFPRVFGTTPGTVQNLAAERNYTNGSTTSYTVNLPAVTNVNASGQASAVCFSDQGASEGNQVPIIITA